VPQVRQNVPGPKKTGEAPPKFVKIRPANPAGAPHCPDFLWRLVALIGVKPGFGLSGIPRHSTCVSLQRQSANCDGSRRQSGKKIDRIIIKPAAALGGGPQQGIDKETGDCAQSSVQRFAGA
jgi:hypothetical protein